MTGFLSKNLHIYGRSNGFICFQRYFRTASHPLLFRHTPPIHAEPLKKRKTVDPQVLLERERKKKTKLAKYVAKLQSLGRKLKPIDELKGTFFRNNIAERQRDRPEQTKEELFYEETVQKRFAEKWRTYNHQFLDEHKVIDAALLEQNKALTALKEESKELYELALEPDNSLLNLEIQGPGYTPSPEHYRPPAGVIRDVTDKFDRSFIDPEKLLDELMGKDRKKKR